MVMLTVALGCGEEPDERLVSLSLPVAVDCRPEAPIASLRVRALGDGPSTSMATIETTRDQPIRALPDLGFPTLAVHAIAETSGWRGIGWRPLGARGDRITLLPLEMPCALAESTLPMRVGSATAILTDGTLVQGGGLDHDGIGMALVDLLEPGAQSADLATRALALQAAFATMTAIPRNRVVFAGGTIAPSAPSYARFQVFDPREDSAPTLEPLQTPRRDHSAILLHDGRVLLVGGRSAEGRPLLDTLELIDPDAARSTPVSATLARPRRSPLLAISEDGGVWIAGGEDSGGERVIERFDPIRETVDVFAGDLQLADPLAVVSLSGDRLAWISRHAIEIVILRDASTSVVRTSDELSLPPLDAARATVTLGGRILVLGDRDDVPGGYLFDPGTGEIAVRASAQTPEKLVTMVDGSVVELTMGGASLRREQEPNPYADPPETLRFGSDDDWWVRDPIDVDAWASPRWERSDTRIVALEVGARVDLRALRGSRWSMELRASKAVDIVLIPRSEGVLPSSDLPLTIEVRSLGVSIGTCTVPHHDGAPVSIGVDRGVVEIGSQGQVRRCETPDLGILGIAFVARERGATLSEIDLRRR